MVSGLTPVVITASIPSRKQHSKAVSSAKSEQGSRSDEWWHRLGGRIITFGVQETPGILGLGSCRCRALTTDGPAVGDETAVITRSRKGRVVIAHRLMGSASAPPETPAAHAVTGSTLFGTRRATAVVKSGSVRDSTPAHDSDRGQCAESSSRNQHPPEQNNLPPGQSAGDKFSTRRRPKGRHGSSARQSSKCSVCVADGSRQQRKHRRRPDGRKQINQQQTTQGRPRIVVAKHQTRINTDLARRVTVWRIRSCLRPASAWHRSPENDSAGPKSNRS